MKKSFAIIMAMLLQFVDKENNCGKAKNLSTKKITFPRRNPYLPLKVPYFH